MKVCGQTCNFDLSGLRIISGGDEETGEFGSRGGGFIYMGTEGGVCGENDAAVLERTF
jgi:hypothetical protein